MTLLDIFDNKIKGILKVTDLENNKVIFEDSNLIVSDASFLLREFLAGNDIKGIKYIAVGDMNLTSKDDVENVRPPACTDYELDHEVYRKEVEISSGEDEYGYFVNYSIILEKDECNGVTGKQLITEYGLLSESVYTDTNNKQKLNKNIMFSRKTRAAIYKDFEMRMRLDWKIYFKKNCN